MTRKIIISKRFKKKTKHLDNKLKDLLKKQIIKIIENPESGKPLKYLRGERSLYLKPFRIVYTHSEKKGEIVLLKFEHRKKVYKK